MTRHHAPPACRSAAFALLAIGLALPASSLAQTPPPGRGAQQGEDRRELADAVRRVERATRGEVLSAERVPFDGRDVSRVKVVDASGRVRVYMDDPQGRRDRAGRGDPPRTRGNDANSD